MVPRKIGFAPLRVIFSVDTEASIGGAWTYPDCQPVSMTRRAFCETDQGPFGLPFIVDELERYGMRATFLCEMLACGVLGEGDVGRATEYLLTRGQDVQLHVHPTFRFYADYLQSGVPVEARRKFMASDHLAELGEAVQEDVIGQSIECFRRLCGYAPTAFRAGSYAANSRTLRALERMGILLDSSYNPAYAALGSFVNEGLIPNRVQRIGGVIEYPVTVARSRLPEGNGLKAFEVSSLSFWEMRRILDEADRMGLPTVVAVLHSFSFIKASDFKYTRLRPDRIVISRFKRLLAYLSESPERFRVTTFSEEAKQRFAPEPDGPSAVPDLGILRPACRQIVQAANRVSWL